MKHDAELTPNEQAAPEGARVVEIVVKRERRPRHNHRYRDLYRPLNLDASSCEPAIGMDRR